MSAPLSPALLLFRRAVGIPLARNPRALVTPLLRSPVLVSSRHFSSPAPKSTPHVVSAAPEEMRRPAYRPLSSVPQPSLLASANLGPFSFKQMFGTATSFVLNFRFYFVFMARATFQAVRPLLAFVVFGEIMKMALAAMSAGLFIFFFSFLLAFEVFYFFLQCYISYVFLGMFFTAAF